MCAEFIVGFVPDGMAQEAVDELLGSHLSYSGGEVLEHLGSYDRKLLALRSSESPPQALSSMLDGDARVYVEDFKNFVLGTLDWSMAGTPAGATAIVSAGVVTVRAAGEVAGMELRSLSYHTTTGSPQPGLGPSPLSMASCATALQKSSTV